MRHGFKACGRVRSPRRCHWHRGGGDTAARLFATRRKPHYFDPATDRSFDVTSSIARFMSLTADFELLT
jgi:hypothetical protein